eukprot:1145349-Pelagomonas_calceolata.AAC.2
MPNLPAAVSEFGLRPSKGPLMHGIDNQIPLLALKHKCPCSPCLQLCKFDLTSSKGSLMHNIKLDDQSMKSVQEMDWPAKLPSSGLLEFDFVARKIQNMVQVMDNKKFQVWKSKRGMFSQGLPARNRMVWLLELNVPRCEPQHACPCAYSYMRRPLWSGWSQHACSRAYSYAQAIVFQLQSACSLMRLILCTGHRVPAGLESACLPTRLLLCAGRRVPAGVSMLAQVLPLICAGCRVLAGVSMLAHALTLICTGRRVPAGVKDHGRRREADPGGNHCSLHLLVLPPGLFLCASVPVYVCVKWLRRLAAAACACMLPKMLVCPYTLSRIGSSGLHAC